jgi:hypothetical protein
MRCPITISIAIQVKPCVKSLHFDISSGKKKRERRKNNFTSPAPKPKQKPTNPILRAIRALIGWIDVLCKIERTTKTVKIINRALFLILCVLISTADK